MPEFGSALDALLAERDKTQKKLDALNRAIAALAEDQEASPRRRGRRPKAPKSAAASARPKRKRRPFSEETKAKMREAQRRRRATEKGQAGTSSS